MGHPRGKLWLVGDKLFVNSASESRFCLFYPKMKKVHKHNNKSEWINIRFVIEMLQTCNTDIVGVSGCERPDYSLTVHYYCTSSSREGLNPLTSPFLKPTLDPPLETEWCCWNTSLHIIRCMCVFLLCDSSEGQIPPQRHDATCCRLVSDTTNHLDVSSTRHDFSATSWAVGDKSRDFPISHVTVRKSYGEVAVVEFGPDL